MLPTITINGRAVDDAELRFTGGGKAVASFRVACSESRKNAAGEWEDGDRLFLGVSVFGDTAEQIAEQVTKGTRVLVEGRLFQREYEARDGSKRQSYEIKFADVAPIIVGAKTQRSSAPAPAADDPWGAPRGGGNDGDTPPF